MFLQFGANGTSETRVDPITGVKVFSRPVPPGPTSFTVRSTDGCVRSLTTDCCALTGVRLCHRAPPDCANVDVQRAELQQGPGAAQRGAVLRADGQQGAVTDQRHSAPRRAHRRYATPWLG